MALLHAHRRRYHDPHSIERDQAPTLLPLVPDRLGEDFIGAHLAAEPHAAELVGRALDAGATGRGPVDTRRCLIMLAAAAPRHPVVRDCLLKLLESHPHLITTATSDVVQLVVDHGSGDLAGAVDQAMPSFSTR